MKALAGLFLIPSYVLTLIVMYHVMQNAAPDYFGCWLTSVILAAIGLGISTASEYKSS